MKHSTTHRARALLLAAGLGVAFSSDWLEAGLARAQGSSAGAQEKPQIFRAGVDVVSLNVTVVDGQNRYVTDIAEEEFSVFEDGLKQELTFFNRTSLPIALSLLIDTSASMESRLSIAQEAAVGFAKR